MKLPFQPKPKTLADRLDRARGEVIARVEDVRDEAVKLLRDVPTVLDTSRKRALAVAGTAASAAAGFAFWRSRREDTPATHQDPAQPNTPWKTTPQPAAASGSESATPAMPKDPAKKPSAEAAAANAAGSRSK